MPVADTDVNIFEDTENSCNGGGGGGGTTDVTIFSSRNTITTEEVSPGEWDVNVAGEESLRYVVANFHEFMEAVVDIGERKARGETTSCVIQVVDDIFFTDATLADEDEYTVNGTKLIDVANKTFLFDWHLFYTTIMCEGTQRHLQLLYPDGNNIDTWQIRINRLRLNNVRLGGGISLYNKHNSTSSSPQHCNFSRYLLASQVNLNYDIRNCQITCCGADNNLSNKLIYEGNGTHIDDQYHTTIVLSNCNFFYGGDAGNNYWSNLNAPIVIYSILTTTNSNQRNITFEKLTKYIGNSSSETGCPNIQFRTVSNSDPAYDTISAWWGNHHWRVTSDGTCLVSSQIADTIDLKTRLALNDLYIQGQPTLQPAVATPTFNWVSLVAELLKRLVLKITDMGENNALTDSDKIYFQGAANTATDANVKRGTLTKLWEWIKGKSDNRYFARYDFVNIPNNGFMGELRYFSSQLNDRLWAADQRFNVTWRGYSSETDEEIYNKDTSTYRLFRGDFELFGAHPVTGEYDLIRIKSKTEGSSMWTYNTGKLILSFYNVAVPPTPPVVRIYGGSTAQWTTLDAPSNPIASVYVYTMPNNTYSLYLKEIEIKVPGKVPGSDPNSAGACLSSVVFIGTRSSVEQESLVTKHAVDQQLYGEFTAKKIITRGGTSSQVVAGDGSLISYPASPMNNGGEMTQQAYNNMGSHDPNTIYIITD